MQTGGHQKRSGALPHVAAVWIAALISGASLTAAAQPASEQAIEPGRDEARERFTRGLALYEEGRDEAALAEFEEAYRVAPAWQVLYNIGRVHARSGRAVEAADALARYLREGGDAVEAERRAEVESLLREQRARIARIVVTSNAEGAVVLLDGVDFAELPLDEPLRIASGTHTLGARAEGYDTVQRSVRLAGGVERAMSFELPRAAEALASLRIACALPGVAVWVDGRQIGHTPLGETVPVSAGEHVIEGRRDGYSTARLVVQAAEGQEIRSELDFREDPDAARSELQLRLPDVSGTVTLDGETVGRARVPIAVVPGPHRLRVELAGRRPLDETIDVPAAGLMYGPALSWSDNARQEQLDGAATQTAAGWVVLAVGAAMLVGGGAWATYGVLQRGALSQEDWALFEDCYMRSPPVPVTCTPDGGGRYTVALQDSALSIQESQPIHIGLGVGLAVLGAAVMMTGIVFAVTSSSPSDIDAGASVQARLGPGTVAIEGQFQ